MFIKILLLTIIFLSLLFLSFSFKLIYNKKQDMPDKTDNIPSPVSEFNKTNNELNPERKNEID